MKTGIIGAGHVGSAAAYALTLRGTASEIVMIDIDEKRAEAHAEDLLHATPFSHSARIRAGDYHLLKGAGTVILACGVAQEEGESRRALLERNAEIFKEVAPNVTANAPDAVLIVASNPVDVITHMVAHMSGQAPEQVIGSGTILDTARFRSLLGGHLGVAARSVHAYVLGEHGPSEVLAWSSARIGGVTLEDFADQVGRPVDADAKSEIDEGVRGAADRIIAGKGATYFGIGAGLARIVQAVRDDEGAVLTVSSLGCRIGDVEDVCLSVPRVVGAKGVRAELCPVLSGEERARLEESARVIRASIKDLKY